MTTERARRARRTAAVVAALTVAAGCGAPRTIQPTQATGTTGAPVTTIDVPPAGAVGAAVRDALPGLYIPDTVDVVPLASGSFTVNRAGPCDELRQILLAGDWSLVSEIAGGATAGLGTFGVLPRVVLLRDGTNRAFAILSDGSSGCTATIGTAASGPTEIDVGAASGSGEGWSVVTSCIDLDDELDIDVVVGLDDSTTSAVMYLAIDKTSADATRAVTVPDEAGDSLLATGPEDVLAVLSKLYAAAAAQVVTGTTGATTEGGIPEGTFEPGTALYTLESEDDHVGTATIDVAAATPRGTITLDGFQATDDPVGGSEGGPVHMTFNFSCPNPVRFAG
jgi:hypothetical protein